MFHSLSATFQPLLLLYRCFQVLSVILMEWNTFVCSDPSSVIISLLQEKTKIVSLQCLQIHHAVWLPSFLWMLWPRLWLGEGCSLQYMSGEVTCVYSSVFRQNSNEVSLLSINQTIIVIIMVYWGWWESRWSMLDNITFCLWQDQLFMNIQDGEYQFPEDEWGCVSQEAKDLISHLLVRDPLLRYTAAQVLCDTWVTMESPKAPLATPRVLHRWVLCCVYCTLVHAPVCTSGEHLVCWYSYDMCYPV